MGQNLEDKPVIAISLLSEIAQAISHLNSDRALLFLTESAVSVTDSAGALLLTPHEKSSVMVPLVKSFQENIREPQLHDTFLRDCYKTFIRLRDLVGSGSASEHEISERFSIDRYSAWPIMLSGKPVALLIMLKPDHRSEFSDEHRSFLELITPFMGSLLENFRLHNEMIHKNSRLSALYEISQQAESLIDFRDVYDALGKVAKSFINFDVYMLYLLSGSGKSLELRLSEGDASSFPRTIKVGEGPIGLAAKELKPYLTYTEDYNSVLLLPIEVSGKLIGIIVIASRKAYAYRDEDIIGLRIIATQIASIDHMFKDLISLRGFTERIMESMTSGVLIFDRVGKVTYANHEIRRMLGRPFPEGWTLEDDHEKLPHRLSEVMRGVLETNITVENEKIKIRNTTPARIIEVNAFPFRNEQGGMMGTVFFIKDVTQISAMEEQLKRADRLSALGVLAAGIAHEIRNPLTGMKMIVQLLESEFSEDDSRREPLGIIQKEIDRLEGIIGNLLDFARPTKPKAVEVEVEKVVDDCYLLVKNQLNKQGINFQKTTVENVPIVIGDPDQLKQVFINIMTNAIQALSPGGHLKVHIDHREEYLVIAFEDSGNGIPSDRLQDIFNPFMTTKEDGTGLGLSMAQRIVEEHGGRIEVQSSPGEGSTFYVHLPIKAETVE
ncbi:MAG: two-component system, NtrC family, sensor histidine kinase AtoS [Clostridiales bacterium]|nr:two-component system, NtrC family, sensor histidine kinase AtoS [Clostridiales bacterium]MDN5281801.1 two-component system, NtrC family, sensor histidine kinase AtoS [Candidatus Ozemobacter sp.]